jgi:stage II sporulation protein D
VPFIIIAMYTSTFEARNTARNGANQSARKIQKCKLVEADCTDVNEHKGNLSDEQLSETFSSTAPIPCETHQLKKVVPQDLYLTDVSATKPRSIQIRVLLDEAHDDASWNLGAEDGFWLLDPLNLKRSISVDESSMVLSSRSGFIFINGKRLTRDKVVIKAKKGDIAYNGCKYQGSLYVVCLPAKMLLINCVDLEDYVACVLNSEAWPGWPLEMNKVLAIAIRTYGVAMMREAADCKRVYHVKNSVAHQVYAGSHSKKELHDAVAQTAGIIMTYRNKPIIAMYDACCGGVITAHIKGYDFVKAPYLARNSACTYCKSCKIYSWTAEFSKDELTTLLKRYIPNLSKIKSIQISKKDVAGLVREVSVKSAHGITALSGQKMYWLPNVKSFCYSIQNTPTKIIFKGRGYGHHVGLCQWGACKMVCDGLDYKRVLRFYYPGITFMKIVR